jgi:hypothetical protein
MENRKTIILAQQLIEGQFHNLDNIDEYLYLEPNQKEYYVHSSHGNLYELVDTSVKHHIYIFREL